MIKKINVKKWAIILALSFVILAFCYYENHHLVNTTYIYESEKVPQEFQNFCIVQISDLHNAVFGNNNKKLVEKIKKSQPDIIVITGDIVDSNHLNMQVSLDFVKDLKEICPIYYVTGNHEYWLEEEKQKALWEGLRDAGVMILNNQCEKITIGEKSISLIGLDDNSLFDNTLPDLLSENGEGLSVVLAHEPQYIEYYSRAGADLVLSGHAHGGQFILPILGPVVAPDQGFLPKYVKGSFTEGKTTMIVSRGLGNSIIPVRLNNDPEIVTVILKQK